MLENFNEFNFNVIDVVTVSVPKFIINLSGASFTNKVLEFLGNPEYVRPLLDADNKAFAVQVCSATDNRAMRFLPNTPSKGYSSSCNVIRSAIRRLMGEAWKDNMRYEMDGVLFPDARAVVFDLNSARELPPFRPLE